MRTLARWVKYRRVSKPMIVVCGGCLAAAGRGEHEVARRTGEEVLPEGWARLAGQVLCPLCVCWHLTP